MIHKFKTFSASTSNALDNFVNAFIGRQTFDGRSIERKVYFSTAFYTGSLYCVSIVYSEENLSN